MVDDLVRDGASVVFLLESAHTDEVKHGYPACGEAGRRLTHAVLGRTDVPLTLLIKHPEVARTLGVPDVSHIAVMNVSRRPLQRTVYEDHRLTPPANMEALQGVKEKFEKKRIGKKKVLTDSEMEKAQKNFANHSTLAFIRAGSSSSLSFRADILHTISVLLSGEEVGSAVCDFERLVASLQGGE